MAVNPAGSNRNVGLSTALEARDNAQKNAPPAASTGMDRNASQQAILRAQIEVNLQAANNSQSLVYRAAVTAINESLSSVLGPEALETAAEADVDVSPEATSDRIIRGATGFFGRYQAQNENLGLQEQIDGFVALINEGVERGFTEARDVLRSLDVLSGKIASDVDATYELVQAGINGFRDRAGASAQVQ